MEYRYDDFINQINIADIHLLSVEYRKLGLPSPDEYPQVEISYKPKKISYCQKGDCFEVIQAIAFDISECSEAPEKRKLFELRASFVLVYKSDIAMDDALFELFKVRNIPVNLHPYARELIQNATTRVGLPAFTLPVLRIKK